MSEQLTLVSALAIGITALYKLIISNIKRMEKRQDQERAEIKNLHEENSKFLKNELMHYKDKNEQITQQFTNTITKCAEELSKNTEVLKEVADSVKEIKEVKEQVQLLDKDIKEIKQKI